MRASLSMGLGLSCLLFLSAANAAFAASEPINTLADLQKELNACVRMPGESPGSELTIAFSLKRDGSLNGKPKISYSHLVGDAASQRQFVSDVIDAFAKCLPLKVTSGLGGAIAGRIFRMRIVIHPHETNV